MTDSSQENSLLQDFIPQLKKLTESECVFGKPYEIGKVTIIPIHSVRIGFGINESKKISVKKGEAGAGALILSPVALLTIKEEEINLLPIQGGTSEKILSQIPQWMNHATELWEKYLNRKNNEKVDEGE